MTWAKLDDSFPENPKIAGLSDRAFRVHVAAICYATRNLTDGKIPRAVLPMLRGNSKVAEELEVAGVWEADPSGWSIHDFLEYNPSREEAETGRSKRAAAGRLGGQRSGETRRSKAEANASRLLEANASRLLEANASRLLEAKSNPDPTRITTAKAVAAAAEANASEPTDLAFGRLVRAWENATGTTVTNRLGESLADWLELLPEAAIVKAIAETGASNARNWRYCEAILKRYQVEGWADKPKAEPYREPPPQERIPMAEEVFEQIRNRPAVPVPDELEYLRANDPEAYERELARRERSRAKLAAHMAANGQAT